ncbi:larval serum protein 1 beta chain-like [Haematobia irritans]|uniref:larval serum protein 1 beta chain-like n=1 Tax=Haematobia irritans TaxID=7368 RepID=UPI003F50A68C
MWLQVIKKMYKFMFIPCTDRQSSEGSQTNLFRHLDFRMKLVLALVLCVGLTAAASFEEDVKIADKSFLEKQKFLFEIVYRVEDPLMFEEWIKLGHKLIVDKSYYNKYDNHMEKFWEAYQSKALLPKGEFFGNLVKLHHMQAWGLFNFFYYAKDWETFQHNVCWARIHVNEAMFVHALTLAVIHRDDFEGLMLPYIYEIFPQYFLNSKFIFAAEKFDYNVWSKYIMYEKEFFDVYYKDSSNVELGDYVYMKDWKMWQWWKLMGLGEHWYAEENFMLRQNINEFTHDSQWQSIMKDVKMWWMPVDYTRDIDFYNEETVLSYFTEDLGLNAFWYYTNMDYPMYLDGQAFSLQNDRRGEFWLYAIHKVVSRYYLERLSNGLGAIPDLWQYHEIQKGYKPQLVSHNGVAYSYRKNYYDVESYIGQGVMTKIHDFFKRMEDVIDSGYYKTFDGTFIDLRKPNATEYVGSMIQGNVDVFDRYFFNYWYMYSNMYLAESEPSDFVVNPHVFLNFQTMMRDPMFFVFHKKIADLFFHFKDYLGPYTKDELLLPGVAIKDVKVTELATYFDLFDYDVTNLLNDKLRFSEGKFVWDKTLLARQMRLNHKPFSFKMVIESEKPQKVFIRVFIAPKYDEFGQVISLNENRKNFFAIDKFSYELGAGENRIHRDAADYVFTVHDHSTYSELYHHLMLAYEGKAEFPLNISRPHCLIPDRLILPRGWKEGMPMQLFVMVTPNYADHEQINYKFSCGIGSGNRWLDDQPFAHPFDREIDEYVFKVPNMYFKDVKIYHYDNFEVYMKKDYKNYGKFDYDFYESYYSKGHSN